MAELSEKNKAKVEEAKKNMDKLGIFYTEMVNGQIQVDKANYWATTGKWYNPLTGQKGTGFNAFVKMLRDNNII